MKKLAMLALIALASCGADGSPIRPGLNIGATITTDGVKPNATASARSGPFTILMDLL